MVFISVFIQVETGKITTGSCNKYSGNNSLIIRNIKAIPVQFHISGNNVIPPDGEIIPPHDTFIPPDDTFIHAHDEFIHVDDNSIHAGDALIHIGDEFIHVDDESIHVHDAFIHVGNESINADGKIILSKAKTISKEAFPDIHRGKIKLTGEPVSSNKKVCK